jgi:hypothetical protein
LHSLFFLEFQREFRLWGKSGNAMELRATYTLVRWNNESAVVTEDNEDGYDYFPKLKDAVFTINLMVQEGKVFRSFAPLISTPIISGGVFHLSFVWEDFDSDVLDKMRDQTDIIEVQFYMRSILYDTTEESYETECSQRQDDDQGDINSGATASSDKKVPNVGELLGSPPFTSNLGNMMRDDKYTDLIIKTGDEEFKVHRVILAS